MIRRLRGRIRKPSPATVLALGAMIFAASGLAFAAIPDKNGVIHACYAKSTGALRVVKNSKCATGEKKLAWNKKGARGAAGARGPSDGYSSSHTAVTNPPAGYGTITHLALPAGSYVLTGKAEVDENQGQVTQCRLNAPTGEIDSTTVFNNGSGSGQASLALAGSVTLPTPATVTLDCQDFSGANLNNPVKNVHETAVRVGVLHPSLD